MSRRALQGSGVRRGSFGSGFRAGIRGGLVSTVTYLQDNFVDTNGVGLNLHTMNVGSGWTITGGGSAGFDIQSNEARQTGNGAFGDAEATADAGQSNVVANVKLKPSGTTESDAISMALRFTDTSNYWSLSLYNGAFRLYENQADGFTQRASSAFSFFIGVQYSLVATLSGQTITCTVDGGNQISYGSASFNQSATKFGLRGSGATGQKWDDFLVTS